jgi:hypothetical protein
MPTAMPVKYSGAALTKMKSAFESMSSRVARLRDKGDAMVEQGTRTLVQTSVGFSLGLLQGKTGGIEVMGLPADLLIGVGAHAAAFAGLGGKSGSKRLHDVGDAAMVVYGATVGRGIGTTWRTTGRLALTGNKVAGELPEGMSGADSLTDEEIASQVIHR